MEDHESRLLDCEYNFGKSFGELIAEASCDQEALAVIYEQLSKMLTLVEDMLYPDDEEN